MFKLLISVIAALLAVAVARPGYLASAPAVYTSHVYQPVVKTHYAAVPVVKHVVTPVVQTVAVPVAHSYATPVVHSVAAPVVLSGQHSYASVPILKSYSSAYVPFKKH